MHARNISLTKLLLAWPALLAFAPTHSQTVEEACRARDARMADARVRVAWTAVQSVSDDVNVAYCVLHGDADAKLSFERNAEIVYFALSSTQPRADRRSYTFTVKTSAGRVIKQGPAIIRPVAREPLTCRVDVCQFFTEPGERVVSVAVQSRRR